MLNQQSAFVRARPIHRWQRHVLQPQIDAELRAVVDQVIHHERSPDTGLWHRENRVAFPLQRPRGHQLGVGFADERGACRRHVVIELLQQVGTARRLLRRLTAGDVGLGLVQRDRAPARELGDVLRQLPERLRLLVRLPGELVLRDALQEFARDRHLMIELGKQRVDDWHRSLRPLIMMPDGRS